MYGDANCDGEIKMADVIAIMCYACNNQKFTLSDEGKNNADVYSRGDGVDVSDALEVQKFVAQLISEFNV